MTANLDPVLVQALGRALGRGVRTPLHTVLGFLELLSMSDLDDDQQRMLGEIMVGADALVAATDRVLVLVGSSDRNPSSQDVTVRDLLEEAVRASTRTHGVPVEVHVDPALPVWITTDPVTVRQILRELLDNAVSYGRLPIRVTAEASSTDGDLTTLRIRVGDAGDGLPRQVTQALDRGVPVPSDTTGVGLLIARRLASSLGAELSADRDAVSLSVAVAVAPTRQPLTAPTPLPVAPDMPVPAGQTPAPSRHQGATLRVLLVEDNAVNRLLAQRQLARFGHDVTTVSTGGDAVAAIADGTFDVVLLDRHLPDFDGLEVTRRVRTAEGGGPRIPILAVTADASPRAREECLAAGMDGYLTKPLDLDSLESALAHFVVEPEVEPLDPSALTWLRDQLTDADLDETLAAYLADLPVRRLSISAAARRGTLPALQAAADSLRGSSTTIGASALAETCAEVALAAGTGDLAAARLAVKELPGRCSQVERALRRITQERRAPGLPVG